MSPKNKPQKKVASKQGITVELLDGQSVHFEGRMEVLGCLIDLIADGLKISLPLKPKSTKK